MSTCCWRNWNWDQEKYAEEDLGCTALCPSEAPVPHAAKCPASKQASHGGPPCAPGCEAGYAPSGRTLSYTCDNNSKWTGGDMVCSPVHCDGRPPTPNALPCDEKAYGEQCAARCAPGYKSYGGGSGTYTCAADGRWQRRTAMRRSPSGSVLWAAAWLTCVCGREQCPGTLFGPNCPHCRPKEGECLNREEKYFCLAACDDGFYATKHWVAKDEEGHQYPDSFECFCIDVD